MFAYSWRMFSAARKLVFILFDYLRKNVKYTKHNFILAAAFF